MTFTAEEKRKALERELAIRRSVYPGRVARHRMTERLAAHQIKIFEEIRDDYAALEHVKGKST